MNEKVAVGVVILGIMCWLIYQAHLLLTNSLVQVAQSMTRHIN